MMKSKIFIAIASFYLLFSCKQNEVYQDNISDVGTKLSSQKFNDTLVVIDNILPIAVNPDSIKSKLMFQKFMLNEDPYLSNNMYALRDMAVTFQARSGVNSTNKFLQTNGKGKELSLNSSDAQANTSFKIRVLPASSGIPYLIYSNLENTPISVGQYASDPNNKVLYLLNDESGSLYNASWDLIPSSSSQGHFAIESQSYLEQGPGGVWDVFYNSIELKSATKIGYGRYSNKAQQEFLITPRNKFTLTSIEYVNEYTSTVTKSQDLILKGNYINTGYADLSYDIECLKSEYISSNYAVNKSINFAYENPAQKFKRPSVLHGVLNMTPGANIQADAAFNSSGYTKSVSAKVPFLIPGRTQVAVDYKVAVYNVSVDFVALGIYQDREIKISGRWSGKVISDEYPLSDHIYNIKNIDTGVAKAVNIPNSSLKAADLKKPITIQ